MNSSVRVVLDYDCSVQEGQAATPSVLPIHIGDQFQVVAKTSPDWWLVRSPNRLPFYLPVSCVEEIIESGGCSNIRRVGALLSRSESSLDRLKDVLAVVDEQAASDKQTTLGGGGYEEDESPIATPPGLLLVRGGKEQPQLRRNQHQYSSSGCSEEDEERGECFDNPVYALPNVGRHAGGTTNNGNAVDDLDLSRLSLPGNRRKNRFSKVEYVNMKLSLDCAPPTPTAADAPIRTLEDSWEEFEDSLGRRYFFHPRTTVSSWKPPRKQMNLSAGEMDADEIDSDSMSTDPTYKVAGATASSEGAKRLHEDSVMPGIEDCREANTQMTTNLFDTEAAKVTAQLYSDLPPSPSPTQSSSFHTRHVNFMPRYNRSSSLMEDKADGASSFVLRDLEAEKENSIEEEEKRKSASLPRPFRIPPSQNFLALRRTLETQLPSKISPPERSIKTRSVMVLSEAHILELASRIGGMRNSKTLPTMQLGKTWRSDEDGQLRGYLNVTKFMEKGRQLKKKQWMVAYVVLTDSTLYVYRSLEVDQLPEVDIDLSGATISWSSKERSRRKNVFEVSTADSSQILLQDDNKTTSQEWVNGIMNGISALTRQQQPPQHSPNGESLAGPVKVLPVHPELAGGTARPMSPRIARLLGRSPSAKVRPENGLSNSSEATDVTPSPTAGQSGQTHKKKKSVDESDVMVDPKVKKLRIIERLKNFFSRRPTLESLKAKGIIRDGPVFGCNFLKLCDQEKNNVPTIVRRCIAAIEKKDMKADGIYRVSGNLSQVQKLRFQIDQDKYAGMESEEDVNVLTGLLKLFFRELKEPMLPFSVYDALMKANKIQDKSAKEKRFRDLVAHLPGPNAETFRFLFQHLYRVADLGEHNRMRLPNLAIVFGPTLMWPEVPLTKEEMPTGMLAQNQVVEYLLINFRGLFERYNTI
ncbi:Rho GTPase-activating protein 27 [Hypsibius exemplaris]|uniref:Rho GTPase-activating protein 27 n=1 Tax=Hypsibius exemplaris TaxID=2072580 RepID=A0A1W0WTY2_HYPEX|nr:Rho GTPase-activating protein 27 [Hypsibius exemplaris]